MWLVAHVTVHTPAGIVIRLAVSFLLILLAILTPLDMESVDDEPLCSRGCESEALWLLREQHGEHLGRHGYCARRREYVDKAEEQRAFCFGVGARGSVRESRFVRSSLSEVRQQRGGSGTGFESCFMVFEGWGY